MLNDRQKAILNALDKAAVKMSPPPFKGKKNVRHFKGITYYRVEWNGRTHWVTVPED